MINKFLTKNNLLLAFSVIIKFGAILIAILINRWQNNYLKPEELKDFNLSLAYLAIILGIIDFGIPKIIFKYFTNHKKVDKLGNFWLTMLVLRGFTFFVGIIIIIISYKLSGITNLALVLSIFLAQFILLADQSFRSVVDSRDKSIKFSATDFFSKFLLTIILYLGIRYFSFNSNLWFFVFIAIVIYFITYVSDYILNKKDIPAGKFDFQILKKNAKSLFYLALPGLIYVNTLDRIFLEMVGTDKFVFNGYSNAIKIYEVAYILPALVVPVLASRLKNKVKELNQKQIQANFRKYLFYLLSLGIFYAGSIYIFSPLVFTILDPQKLYIKYSLQVIGILALAIIPIFISFFIYNWNIFNHREKQESYYYYLYVIILASLFWFFTNYWGFIGSATAVLTINYLDLLIRTTIFRVKILESKI